MAHLHTTVELALIGRRVRYSGPYGSASGLIYATHAHTEPATVPGVSRCRIAAGGLQPIERGPVESVDLVLDDNRTMQRFPWHMITVPEGAPHNGYHPVLMLDTFGEEAEIAELLANAARAKAEAAAKETEEKARFAAEVQRLKTAHPELIQPDNTTSRAVTAARNCRVLLKAAFPGIKFSVRSGRATYSSTLDIKWTDGPTPAQVEAVTDQFKGGFFDGMADIYESRDTPFTAAFGDADYVSATRERSDALILRTIAHIAEKYGEKDRPTLEDYHAGRCNSTSPLENETGGHWSWSDLIYRTSREIDASTPAPAAAHAEVREEAAQTATAAEVQAWSAEQFDREHAALEAINEHGEALTLRAMRHGDGGDVAEARAICAERARAGELTPALSARSAALSEKLHAAQAAQRPQDPPEEAEALILDELKARAAPAGFDGLQMVEIIKTLGWKSIAPDRIGKGQFFFSTSTALWVHFENRGHFPLMKTACNEIGGSVFDIDIHTGWKNSEQIAYEIDYYVKREIKEAAGRAPALLEYTTKRGKVLTGIIRTDLTREQAEQIDPYTFIHPAGGWFIRARHLDN